MSKIKSELCTPGPCKWHENYPIAASGVRQSPIDIDTSDADGAVDDALKENPLAFAYPAAGATSKDVENTGASFKVNAAGDGEGTCERDVN